MKLIKVSDLKTNCLGLVDEVAATGSSFAITKNGKPVAMLTPYGKDRASLAGIHRSSVKILGDIVSPFDDPWEAER